MTSLPLNELVQNDKVIYVVTRLFDLYEKMKTEYLEQSILAGLAAAADQQSLTLNPTSTYTFVPFRDTEQDMLEHSGQTRQIFEDDMAMLDKTVMLMGFMDGLSKDEGVCYEIGYAFGKGIPAFLILTDFIYHNVKPDQTGTHLIDPILDTITARLLQFNTLDDSEDSFLRRLKKTESRLHRAITDQVSEILQTPLTALVPDKPEADNSPDVYIEFGGGRFEWQRRFQSELSIALRKKGYSVAVSERFRRLSSDTSTVQEAAWLDIANALSAKTTLIASDSLEMDPGSAAIQGLCRANNKRIILYDSGLVNIAGDRQYLSSRNLMIEHSASHIISSLDDVWLYF